jgi:hypothetical protein
MGNNRRHHLKNNSKLLNSLSLIIAGLFSLSLILVNKTFFTVKKIDCQQNNQPCLPATLDKLTHLYNQSLFFTNFNKTLSQFFDYQINKKLPDTLVLKLENVQAHYYRLNEESIFEIAQEESLDKNLNQQINDLTTGLTQAEIKYQNIKIKKDVFIILLETNYRVLIDKNDVSNGVYKLNQILKNIELKEIDTAIQEIDTRFKMPVLKTKQTVI